LYTVWKDHALRAQLGRRGYDGVRAHYTIQRSADMLLKVYTAVASGREVFARPEGPAYTLH
jgi:hypothetical protein